jgi:hypothetical protein
VDHPFHAVRAESLRQSLGDGQFLRWVGQHQAGYPAEFYPFGAAALDLAGWALTLGQLPMAAVHKLVVIALFLLPGAAFMAIAWRDRLSPAVALIALAGQIGVRGWWWSGGGQELVEWGLFSNVAALTLLLLAIPAGAGVLAGSWPAVAALGLVAAWSILASPRSAIALLALAVGIAATWLLDDRRLAARSILLRAGSAAGIAAAVAAPLLVPLLRFGDLYLFVHYSTYEDFRDYLDSSVQAVGSPLLIAGAAGLGLALTRPAGRATSIAAWTLVSYLVLTMYIVAGTWPASLIQQLEPTRLMPFQRYLWLFFAGFAVVRLVERLARRVPARGPLLADSMGVAAAGLVLWLYVWSPPAFIPESDRGMVEVPHAAQAAIADLRSAVRAADEQAPDGTALLVLGTTISWHDGLWAPLWSDRRFFYDDWLWYWHELHFGDYDPLEAHAYLNDASALDPEYLARHGIGAVIVTGPQAKPVAPNAAHLRQVRTGIYDVYLVDRPTALVSSGNLPLAVSRFDDREVLAQGRTDGEPILLRHNWYPRWRAFLDGVESPIARTDDGYMQMAAPAGEHRLRLEYRVDTLDWASRAACVVGLVLAAAWLAPDRLRRVTPSPESAPR